MALPADYIERLKAANPIAEIMGGYVTLKRTGRDYVCLCPFHNEKTPSCHVHPDKEFFHCFGCGAGGDVITFTMKYNNLDYMDAVRLLAERSGLPVPEDRGDGGRTESRKRLYELNKEAARFFYSQLKTPEGRGCLDYLMNVRKLRIETIKKYGMGFAPNSWSALKKHMLSKGYSEQELIDASLVTRSQKTGRSFDFFVDRAMFPFIDLSGHIVGFGGRALSQDDKRKYLNSSDTLCYDKRRFLFSMNFAKNEAVKSGKLLLCEGNLDVISLNQAGFEGAVASCGTALTPEQAKLISNYAEQVVICYDMDEAGRKAASKAIGLLSGVGLKVTVLNYEGAKDPDEYINKFGADHFRHLVSGSEGAVEFELRKCREGLDISTDLGKIDYLKKAYRVLAGIGSAVERDIYISKVAEETSVSKNAIEQEILSLIKRERRAQEKRDWTKTVNFTNYKRDQIDPEANVHRKEAKAERGIIYYLLKSPDKLDEIKAQLSEEDLVTDLDRRLYTSLCRRIEGSQDISVSAFNDEFSPDEVGKLTEMIVEYDRLSVDDRVVGEYIEVLKRYKERKMKDTDNSFSKEDFQKYFEDRRARNGKR